MRTSPRRYQSPRTRRAVLTIVFAAAALPGASAAQAATVEQTPDGTLVYRAAAGEANSLEVSSLGSAIRFTDLRAPISARGAQCVRTAKAPAEVTCAADPTPIRAIVVNLGDRSDTISVRTGIALTVDAGPGDDVFLAGAFAGPSRVDFLGAGGIDAADYNAATAAVRVTRDGVDDDGRERSGGEASGRDSGDHDNIRADVEVVIGQGATAAARRRLRCAPLRRATRARAYRACLRRA